jgi:hypothetical protein
MHCGGLVKAIAHFFQDAIKPGVYAVDVYDFVSHGTPLSGSL